jgi:hypothetical protein
VAANHRATGDCEAADHPTPLGKLHYWPLQITRGRRNAPEARQNFMAGARRVGSSAARVKLRSARQQLKHPEVATGDQSSRNGMIIILVRTYPIQRAKV